MSTVSRTPYQLQGLLHGIAQYKLEDGHIRAEKQGPRHFNPTSSMPEGHVLDEGGHACRLIQLNDHCCIQVPHWALLRETFASPAWGLLSIILDIARLSLAVEADR
jgi:hypothetical protein